VKGGLWKLPELWTRKRTRAHKLLGRRQTDAGAHSYHSPRLQGLSNGNATAILSTRHAAGTQGGMLLKSRGPMLLKIDNKPSRGTMGSAFTLTQGVRPTLERRFR